MNHSEAELSISNHSQAATDRQSFDTSRTYRLGEERIKMLQAALDGDGDQKDFLISKSIFTFLVAAFAVYFWILWAAKRSKKSAPLPPGPRGLPIVGYLPYLGDELHHDFTNMSSLYGPIFRLWLGNKLCVVITSPAVAKEVVRDQDITFSNRDPPAVAGIITYSGNDIAFGSYGPKWRNMRKMFVREMLSNTNLDACYDLRREEVIKAVKDLYKKVGQPIDVGQLAFLTEVNAILSLLWGGKVSGQKGADIWVTFRGLVGEIMDLLGKPDLSDFFPALKRFDLQGLQGKMRKIQQYCDKLFDEAIEERMGMGDDKESNKKGPTDFMQFLLDLNKSEDPTTNITHNQLKAMLVDVVVGGTDTTSTMVEWGMAELLYNPSKMEKLKNEIAAVVGLNNFVEESHLPKLPYLEAVLKETLRLHPPLPFLIPRSPSESTTVAGYSVPKGSRVFLNVYGIHRNPQYWESPNDFKPERFLNGQESFDFLGNDFRYMPFGSGRRFCAGRPLGEKMVSYLLATLVHSFDWKVPEGKRVDLEEHFGIVLRKSNPLVAVPTPRLTDVGLYKE